VPCVSANSASPGGLLIAAVRLSLAPKATHQRAPVANFTSSDGPLCLPGVATGEHIMFGKRKSEADEIVKLAELRQGGVVTGAEY
jgi:hypothetical protein